jgi:Domain of unknown function (DUF4331)
MEMRKTVGQGLLVLGVLCLAVPASRAADHRDGNTALADATTDITDVYAFMSTDGSKVELIMDIQGANTGAVVATKFSNVALYVLHFSSAASYNPLAPTVDAATLICTFDTSATQKFQCWGPGGEYVTGATGVTAGVASSSGKMKVFAGLRDDPFHFNIRGFKATTAAVVATSPTAFASKVAGCPTFTDTTVPAQLVAALQSNGMGGAGTDDFAPGGASPPQPGVVTNGNVLSIAIELDKTLLATSGAVVSVWGSTNKAK